MGPCLMRACAFCFQRGCARHASVQMPSYGHPSHGYGCNKINHIRKITVNPIKTSHIIASINIVMAVCLCVCVHTYASTRGNDAMLENNIFIMQSSFQDRDCCTRNCFCVCVRLSALGTWLLALASKQSVLYTYTQKKNNSSYSNRKSLEYPFRIGTQTCRSHPQNARLCPISKAAQNTHTLLGYDSYCTRLDNEQ